MKLLAFIFEQPSYVIYYLCLVLGIYQYEAECLCVFVCFVFFVDAPWHYPVLDPMGGFII